MDYVLNNILLTKEQREKKTSTIIPYDMSMVAEKKKKEGNKQHA